MSKTPFFKIFSNSKFSVSDKNNFKNKVGCGFYPNKNNEIQKSNSCHPELASPLVADEKKAYKGGCSQSISGSSHRQKCADICTQKFNVGLKAQPTSTAFTLAEVLITLGIIGVVAAMTLPTLIAKYRREVLKAEFKKTYNELQQINLSFIKDTGSNICEYDWILVDNGEPQMMAAVATTEKVVSYYKGKGESLNNRYNNDVKTLTGGKADIYKFDDGNMWNFLRKTFYTEYGASEYNTCLVITVDINGYHEKPNQLGIDMFSFRPTKDGRIIPLGNPNNANDSANGSKDFTDCSKEITTSINGMGCAYWASIDVNPDDNTKDYWNDFINY